jgi:hypothetical protein
VAGDHPVELLVAREREVEPDPEAVQYRVPGTEAAQTGRGLARPVQPVAVLVAPQPDVVAEPLRLLVRVGVAADVGQQGRVVDDGPLLVVQPDVLGDPQRDPALPHHVLHRLAETEVDAQRQRADQLGQTHPVDADIAALVHRR